MNNIFYPEISTHKSIRLNSAPKNNDRPPVGYIYQWESIVEENNEKVIYMNFMFDDGSTKQYSLNSNINNQIIVPNEIEDFIFDSTDFDENTHLIIDNNYIISQIGLFVDESKSSYNIINASILCNETQSIIDMNDIPCPYGGIVKFAQGSVVINYDDDVYNISQLITSTEFDANNGLIQICHNVNDYVNISSDKVINLKENKMIKIFVNKNENQTIFVEDQEVDFDKFCVCYMNLFGNIQRIGEIIKIG